MENMLVEAGLLDPAQLDAARAAARETGETLDGAAVRLGLTTHAAIGAALSRAWGLPYQPLLDTPPDRTARRHLSYACASRWGLLPLAHDTAAETLTVAVAHPTDAERFARVARLLLLPYQPRFTVAGPAELEAAFRRHFGDDDADAARRWSQRPSALSGPPTRHEVESAAGPQAATATRRWLTPELVPWQRTVLRLLDACLAHDDAAATGVFAQALRHSQLLAARLSLPPGEASMLELAVRWAALAARHPDAVGKAPPELAAWMDAPPTSPAHLAARSVLRLALAYGETQATGPGATSPADLLSRRRLLQRALPPEAPEEALETFLQVLADEEFLARSDRGAGAVLFCGMAETVPPALATLPARTGCRLRLAPDAAEALRLAREDPPDVLIVDLAQDMAAAMSLLQALRGESPRQAPTLMLDSQPDAGRERACLRAGASDYVTRSGDAEILRLRVERHLEAAASRRSDSGVSGSLSEMSFADMVQILGAGGRSLQIQFLAGERSGCVYLREGRVVHAATDRLTGEPAFLALMRLRTGEFRTLPCSEFPPETIAHTTLALLLEGARQLDEEAASD